MHFLTRRYGFGRTVICLMVALRVASSQYESAGKAQPPSASPPPSYDEQPVGATEALYATQKPESSSRAVSRTEETTEAPPAPSSVSSVQVTTVAASSPTDADGNGGVKAAAEEPEEKEEFRGGCVADTIFVIDSTSSVSKIFEKHIEYVKNVVELLDISPEANHVALIAYASHRKNRVRYSLSDAQSKEQALVKLQALPFIGGITATGAALDVALKELDKTRSNVGANVVVVTDGFSYDHVEDQAIHLHALENVRTFAVSIGPYRREYELVILAGSEKNVFRGFDTFRELADRLQQCIAGQTPGVTGGGVGKSATTDEGGYEDNSVPASVAPTEFASSTVPPETKQHCSIDVVFVIDASGSLNARFQRQLETAVDIIDAFPQDTNTTRLSVIKFAGPKKSRIVFPFSNLLSGKDLKEQIRRIRFTGGTTYINEALVKAANELANSTDDGARQVVVVFTDGFTADDPSKAAKALHRKGIPVLAVALDSEFPVNRHDLEVIADDRSHVFYNKDIGELKSLINELANEC